MRAPDTLTITSNGKVVDTWEEFSVTRGIEVMPSGFTARVTEHSMTGQEHDLRPFQPFTARLGNELAITGYLDDPQSYSAPGVHGMTITGRSKCQDLVDCSAETLGMVSDATALSLATQLAAPYGITASSRSGPGGRLETFAVNVGETPFEVIERYAAFSGFLVYDDPQGNLVLARLAEGTMASGFRHGENVEQIARTESASQRFSHYEVYWQALSGTNDEVVRDQPKAVARDENVPRNRKLKMVSDLLLPFTDPVASSRIVAGWQMWRRWGRSQTVRLTCSSWRDSAGRLWQPNYRARVHAPKHRLENADWLIASVTFNKGQQGTTADLVLMPEQAFQVQLTNPFGGGINDLRRATGSDTLPEGAQDSQQ